MFFYILYCKGVEDEEEDEGCEGKKKYREPAVIPMGEKILLCSYALKGERVVCEEIDGGCEKEIDEGSFF